MVDRPYAPPRTLMGLPMILAAVLTACSASPNRPSDDAALQAQAAHAVHRVCSLLADQRQAEIQRIKEQSGVVIGCGTP